MLLHQVLEETTKLAIETIRNDTIVLLNHEPLYAYLLEDTSTQVVRTANNVAAVSISNGDFTFHMNPEGYLCYSQRERLFILKHEWTHWIEEHPLQNEKYIPSLWNLACDISINQTLETEFCVRPSDALIPEMYQFPPHLSPEAYYELLLEVAKKDNKKKKHAIDEESSDSKQKQEKDKPSILKGYITRLKELSNGFFLVRLDEKTIVFTKDSCFFNMSGSPITFQDLQTEQYAEALVLEDNGGYVGTHLRLTEPKPEEMPLTTQISINGKDMDEETLNNMHPQWKTVSQESPHMVKKNLEDKVNQALKNVEEQFQKSLPNHLKERLQNILKSNTNWKGQLKMFVGSQKGQKKDYTYRKRNRRTPLSPGIKKAPQLRLGIILDTSISIPDSLLHQFNAEIKRIASTNRNIKIIIIICDCVVHDVYEYNQRLIREGITVSGRGGTDFRPAFEIITKREHALLKQKLDAVVYLTDGIGIAPTVCPIPTLWALTGNGQMPFAESFQGEHITWGRAIYIE